MSYHSRTHAKTVKRAKQWAEQLKNAQETQSLPATEEFDITYYSPDQMNEFPAFAELIRCDKEKNVS